VFDIHSAMADDLVIAVRAGEGDDLLVIDDKEILNALGRLLAQRLGVNLVPTRSTPRPLHPVPDAGRAGEQREQ